MCSAAAIAKSPRDVHAYAGLGKALIQLKRYEETVAAMEKAVRLDSELAVDPSLPFARLPRAGPLRGCEAGSRRLHASQSQARRRARPGCGKGVRTETEVVLSTLRTEKLSPAGSDDRPAVQAAFFSGVAVVFRTSTAFSM